MQSYLVFTLAANMAAMAELAGHERRGSLAWPGRSALLGLLAAALGRRRDADFSDLDALDLAMRDFHVNKIKIDKSFVTHLETDEGDPALVDGLIALARRLGLKVVAEGVETQGQLDYLRGCGCNYLQGYIHSKPLSVEDAIKFLASQSQETNLIGPRNAVA